MIAQRMEWLVVYRDSKGATKSHAVFRALDSNSVVPISVHVAPPLGRRPIFLLLTPHYDLERLIRKRTL